ncbi:MAG: beta-lactamase family protein [Alphaproteobacteria bacterium]|nr:beta-lactamase family protein [Alphaproteobacteria bacterium]
MIDVEKILQDVENFERSHILNGTLLVAVGNKVVYEKGFGIADAVTKTPCTVDTQYNIASVTKQFTAAALLRVLYDANPSIPVLKHALHKPLSKYLPPDDILWDGEIPEWAELVTLHHLLTHTSGIVNYTDLDSFYETIFLLENPSILDLVSLFKDKPLTFEPGSKYAYCNSSYFLLGQIISRLSHKSFSEYLRETFFVPLGMVNTSLPARGTSLTLKKIETYSKLARGYTYDVESWAGPYKEIENYWPLEIDQGDGGIISTAADLIKWNNGLYKGRVLPLNVRELLLTPYIGVPDKPDTSYCYGIVSSMSPVGQIFEHGGGIPGYRTYLIYVPSLELTVVSFANLIFDFTCIQEKRNSLKQELSHIEDEEERESKYNEIFKKRYPEVQNILQNHSLFLVDDLTSLKEA